MNTPQIPKAKKVSCVTERHGEKRNDPYAWLKDPNWQEVLADPTLLDKDIRAHLLAENEYTRSVIEGMRELQDQLQEEMRGRIEEDTASPPTPDGEWVYYTRQVAGGDYTLYCRKLAHDRNASEEVLFDGNKEAEGKSHFSLGVFSHSPDHRFIMYSLDCSGSEIYQLYVKDLSTGEVLKETIPLVSDAVWANDSRTIYYTKLDEYHRPEEVYRHILKTPSSSDTLIFKPKAPGFFVALGITESRGFITINVEDHDSGEVYLLPGDGSSLAATLVCRREKGLRYSVQHHPDGYLLILTNADGAEDFQIMRAPVGTEGRSDWVPFVAHRFGVLITQMVLRKDHLIRIEEERALPRIIIQDAKGDEHAIAFEEEAYSLSVSSGFEFVTDTIRFTYSSPTTPAHTYDYNVKTREKVLVYEKKIPSGHDPKDYVVKRVVATSNDGEEVPVTLLYHSSLSFSEPPPCLLYGYGAYGFSMDASFRSRHLSLVDRGFVFAVAHIRGGMEKGYHWYLDGKMLKKKNTFLDFIAVAEMLVVRGYSAPQKIAIEGRSAGGMLVGAVVNMRPDLFGAVVAGVPFVDVLNTMSDTSLPLTPMEWLEWGNPIDDRDAYEYIKSYSPYDNVLAQKYPHMFVTAGLTDPRVTYWEPAKWVAKLREHNESKNIILLQTEMEHGHQGSTGRFKSLEDDARIYAFVISALAGKLK